MYRNLHTSVDKPHDGKAYIVTDSEGRFYHIAFWDNNGQRFINQTGILNESFIMFAVLPMHNS